jgi:hypothetical protein
VFNSGNDFFGILEQPFVVNNKIRKNIEMKLEEALT